MILDPFTPCISYLERVCGCRRSSFDQCSTEVPRKDSWVSAGLFVDHTRASLRLTIFMSQIFSCTKHGGSEPCEAAFWKYPYMTLTWLLHPSCHNLIINRDFLGGKLERLVIFWFMSKVFFDYQLKQCNITREISQNEQRIALFDPTKNG